MNRKKTRLPASVLALALLLSLLAACGGDAPEQSQQAAPSQTGSESAEPSQPLPTVTPEPTPEPTTAPVPTQEPTTAPESTEVPEPTPEPAAEPTVEPTPEPTQSLPEDGAYTANVTLAGGSGRASIQSPAELRCSNGQFYATILWSSPNFDYMKVGGARYDPISAPGENSAFEIPVSAFDQALAVVADTVAMSEPHEVEYTLTFDSASLTKQ